MWNFNWATHARRMHEKKNYIATAAAAAASAADFFIGFHNHLSVNKHVIIQIQSAQNQRRKNRQSFGCIFKHIFKKPENPIDWLFNYWCDTLQGGKDTTMNGHIWIKFAIFFDTENIGYSNQFELAFNLVAHTHWLKANDTAFGWRLVRVTV